MNLPPILHRFLLSLVTVPFLVSGAQGASIAPYKDALFAYPATIREDLGGDYRVVAYDEMRDINGRDEVPERRVKGEYLSSANRAERSDLVLDAGGQKIAHVATGKRAGAGFIVIYLHGQGGNRMQGASDLTFGGNFNRIQNLAVRSGGLYLSPDFPDFGSGGLAVVEALASHYLAASPGAGLFLACGSMGGQLCWKAASDPALAGKLSGLLLLGSMWDEGFLRSPAFKVRVPVFFGHGSKDSVFPVERQEAFFRAIRKARPDYPARFVRFETGTHGTPIRMVDWRETLNWMMAARGR